MTGAEHYRAAEERLRASDWQRQEAADAGDLTCAIHEAAIAQVHATLALAAAHGANRCADRDTFAQQCHLEAGHDGQHSIPIPTAERAWA